MGLDTESPVHTVWKSDLYRMQLEAPVPVPVLCVDTPPNLPKHLGRDYHGHINNVQATNLLGQKPNGAYLVRESQSANGAFHTLSLKFNDKIHHYRLYHEAGAGLYVREKRYDCVRSLVADGLITMHLEMRAPNVLQRLATANYQESPYMTLNKKKRKALTKDYWHKQLQQTENQTIPPLSTAALPNNLQQQLKAEKAHAFKMTTFKGLNWCELCANFLWGLKLQGKRCDDCGVIAHVKCSEKFDNDCVPDLKYVRGAFGIELTTFLSAHKASLPFVVTNCVAEVEARGLTTEGIYRLSGNAEELDAIKLALDRDGESTDLSVDKYPNINVIAGTLKNYLRFLPVPLITFEVHPKLIDAIQHKQQELKIACVRDAILQLPKAHYDTLKFMIEHLNRIACHSAINKMTELNLATVFAPTLIQYPTDTIPLDRNNELPDVRSDINLIEILIKHCYEIFIK